MKKIALTAVTLLLTSMSLATVTGAEVASDSQKPADQTEKLAPADAAFDKQLEKVRQQLDTMQKQMQKIQQTQDPKERQKLLSEHWNSMQGTMADMRNLWGCGMGPNGMGMAGNHMGMMGAGDGRCKNTRGHYSSLTAEQMRHHQYMMDQYLGMQQMMMDQMMWQQHYHNGAPARKR
ncbi:hypothetical protein FXN65_14045 [Metapseudomonas lalkuanensis]|uniref:DUF4175 domain-containing protein n=1 Tax=Metapseudomonas lalkuanensis TaxID=2604832 RepID=A0A5J6QK42_9GAMM|nr:hypothetical protein [Pseudomonas lalkuanensis]QEY63128.1 hypothetical protein FXN65_14045 [Pseudomonas lalkuanensis]UCP00791.1 hypothetical protein LF844_13625 [Pseudomonas lalkuanensis]